MKYLLLLPALLLGALPAEAHSRHHHHRLTPRHTLICDQNGCAVRFRQPKIRVSQHCIYKPWSDKYICKY